TTLPTIAVMSESLYFQSGFIEGLTGDCDRWDVTLPADENGIVEIIHNLCEIAAEGWLTEDKLRRDVGLIAGWLSRPMDGEGFMCACSFIPERCTNPVPAKGGLCSPCASGDHSGHRR